MRRRQWKNGKKLEKILAWQLTKDAIDEARNKVRKVHFASLMDLCHLKNSELEPQYQKYKGRVVLRGDIVKGDLGSYAVFTEQGTSTDDSRKSHGHNQHQLGCTQRECQISKTIVDNCRDMLESRISGGAKEKQPTRAYNRSKRKMHRRYWKFPNRDVQIFGSVYRNTKWPKSWSSMEDPVVLVERNLYSHPLAGLLRDRQFEKVLFIYDWEKVPNRERLFVNREKGDYSYLCMWTI